MLMIVQTRRRNWARFVADGRAIAVVLLAILIILAALRMRASVFLGLLCPFFVIHLLIEPSIFTIIFGKGYNQVVFSPQTTLKILQPKLHDNGLIHIRSIDNVSIYKLMNADDDRVFIEERDGSCTMITASDTVLTRELKEILGVA